MVPTVKTILGDCLTELAKLPAESVHCCVTSPPYWQLRNYGVAGQIGLERTPEEYVAKMVEVFREIRRVLREDGTLFLNLGDSYASDTKGSGGSGKSRLGPNGDLQNIEFQKFSPRHFEHCLKPKDLVGIPWRVAFALQADGWWLRSDIIWAKPNPMPESVTDRPTKSHEYLFLLAKSDRYFYDAEAVKEPLTGGYANEAEYIKRCNKSDHYEAGNSDPKGGGFRGYGGMSRQNVNYDPNGRNKRTVWTVATSPYPESHFATFPPDLIKPCILAGTSAKGCCPKCGAPSERVVDCVQNYTPVTTTTEKGVSRVNGSGCYRPNCQETGGMPSAHVKTIGWQPTCECGDTETRPCTVLDPFGGSGTTGQVALELGRNAILIELNPEYVKLAEKRTNVTPGLQLA